MVIILILKAFMLIKINLQFSFMKIEHASVNKIVYSTRETIPLSLLSSSVIQLNVFLTVVMYERSHKVKSICLRGK